MASDIQNKRSDARRKVIKGANIAFNEGRSVLECRVRDLSAQGARLEFTTQQLLPHVFELHLASGAAWACELRWARGTLVGVRFLDGIERPSGSSNDQAGMR